MVRGTFANVRLVNKLMDRPGPQTVHIPSNKVMDIYDAAEKYMQDKRDLIVIAGKEYGTGSARDWAAKGPSLLGIRAVIAQSFERIHRSNLICMGILPLEFNEGESADSLGLSGKETFDIDLNNGDLKPGEELEVKASNGKRFKVKCRIETEVEAAYFKNGGILRFVIRKMLSKKN